MSEVNATLTEKVSKYTHDFGYADLAERLLKMRKSANECIKNYVNYDNKNSILKGNVTDALQDVMVFFNPIVDELATKLYSKSDKKPADEIKKLKSKEGITAKIKGMIADYGYLSTIRKLNCTYFYAKRFIQKHKNLEERLNNMEHRPYAMATIYNSYDALDDILPYFVALINEVSEKYEKEKSKLGALEDLFITWGKGEKDMKFYYHIEHLKNLVKNCINEHFATMNRRMETDNELKSHYVDDHYACLEDVIPIFEAILKDNNVFEDD